MPRVTSDEVGEVIELDDSIEVTPFITVADMLVDERCVTLGDGSPTGYSDTRLKEIVRWLAAHFYSCRDPRATSESVGSIQQQFTFRPGMRLESTWHGQQALVLDTKGGLAALNNGLGEVQQEFPGVTGRKVKAFWLGKKGTAGSGP